MPRPHQFPPGGGGVGGGISPSLPHILGAQVHHLTSFVDADFISAVGRYKCWY